MTASATVERDGHAGIATAVAWLVALLVVVDGTATWWWVTTGQAVEGNPVVAWLIDVFGAGVGLTVRTVVALGLLAVVAALAPRTRRVEPGLAVAACVYAAVVGVHVGFGLMG
jgi:hypothetical protein